MPQTKCGFDDDPNDPNAPKGRDQLVVFGPTMLVDIGFDPSYNPENVGSIPAPGVTGVWALVDTGATTSCIDSQLAASLSLPVIDRRQYGGAGGLHTADIYLAQIHVPALTQTIYGEFAGVNLADGFQQHQALIGRTFLFHYTMIYNGTTGDVTLLN